MDKHLKKCLMRFNSEVDEAVSNGHINGRPFVRYAEDASHIFIGFGTLIHLLQVNEMMAESDDEQEAASALNDYEANTLLSMMRAVSDVMTDRAESLADWADDRLQEGRDGQRR